jgi:short-subunit dehydrogenase
MRGKRNSFFENKVVLITGASSGIGRATALALAERGACLALSARRLPALEELARQIMRMGRSALIVPADVSQRAQVERLIQETISHWKQVDILVANAGQYIRSPVASPVTADIERSAAEIERSMAVNFYGAVWAALAVLPYMRYQRSGHIVFVNSMDAKKGLPPDAPYVAAKCALGGFGDVLRQELHGSGIFVSTIYPGRVDTPMIERLQVPPVSVKIPPEAVAKAILRAIQRKQPEVILPFQAKLLHYLNVFSPGLSDWAARFLHLEGDEI